MQIVLQPSHCLLTLQRGAAGPQEQLRVRRWLPAVQVPQDGPPEASTLAAQQCRAEAASRMQRLSLPLLPAQPLHLHLPRVQLLGHPSTLERF